ncbi:MAG TPA: MBL fold metallo-hydrolase [Mycobacteriales bacterium]|nr:MBL fold metallo-hydrolase [Mycobacteriales bacterium]
MARVTWCGHATVLIEDAGVRVLTDPLLTRRVAHLRRHGDCPDRTVIAPDIAVVSHLHLDHLHLPSLRQLPETTDIVVPRGGGRLLRRIAGGRVHEVGTGDELELRGIRVRAVPAAHDGRRGLWSRARGPALGYVVTGERSTYFAGDTDFFVGLTDLPPLDVALLPVAGWGPTLGPGHMDAGRAAIALATLRARHAIPIHYGTYWPVGLRRKLFTEPGQRFDAAAAVEAPGVQVHVVAPGEAVEVTG